MSEKDQEQAPKETKVEGATPDQQPQSISVQQILSTYPIDRDKCRDVLLVSISENLKRIADSLEAIPQALLLISKELQNKK